MYILDKDDVGRYRAAVGKIAFLQTYPKFQLLENYEGTLMRVKLNEQAKEKNQELLVSIFMKPNPRELEQAASESRAQNIVHIYYQRKPTTQKEENTKPDYQIEAHLLSKEFNELYDKYIEMAFLNTASFMDSVPSAFSHIVTSLFKNEMFSSIPMYKYHSMDKALHNRYKVNDGVISFAHPKSFNDPFDCNCYYANNQSMMDMFRVLCMTKEPLNIPMWSYYAQDHKGYCFRYDNQDILKTLNAMEPDWLCIYGGVSYRRVRPSVKSASSRFNFTQIQFFIDIVFSKYEEWKHEKEFRYVLISSVYDVLQQSRNNTPNFISISVPLYTSIEGVNSCAHVMNANGNLLPFEKVEKHDRDYALTIKNTPRKYSQASHI